ncbi:MAG TPA: hypothetical protein VFY53_00965 [Rhodoplanes sp.]|nr:hypothetical protein [Rhodoplanes sp.]
MAAAIAVESRANHRFRAGSGAGAKIDGASGQRMTPTSSTAPALSPSARVLASRSASGTNPRFTMMIPPFWSRAGVNTEKPGPVGAFARRLDTTE